MATPAVASCTPTTTTIDPITGRSLPKARRMSTFSGGPMSFKGALDLSSYTPSSPFLDCVRINVSGRLFLIREEKIRRFPHSLLASPDRERYWKEELDAYYFDRNREVFASILQFYQTSGVFTTPVSVDDPKVIMDELEFYRITVAKFEVDDAGFEMDVVCTENPTIRQKLYMLLNFPESSTSANVMAWLDCILILLSVAMLIIESEPLYKDYFADNEEEAHKYAFAANSLIMGYFTVDYFLRLISHPIIKDFFKLFLPWLDILSILPFYLEVIMITMAERAAEQNTAAGGEEEHHTHESNAYTILRICRIFRVTRIFKLVRRCESLLVLLRALSKTKNELVLLAAIVSVSSVFMGAIMYAVEADREDPSNKFTSIMTSCWWSIITIATVGYGDMYPSSLMGKIVGAVTVFLALVLIALPATIIVTKFSEEYDKVNKHKQ